MPNVDLKELEKALEPTHLNPNLDELKKGVDAKTTLKDEDQEKEEKAVTDPKSQVHYTFQFDHKDPRGKKWQGKFTTKILSINEMRQAGVLQSQLNGGVPQDQLDMETRGLNLAIARMTYCLTEKPDWYHDELLTEEAAPATLDVFWAIYAEVTSHEDWFRQHGETKARSKK